jgi:hypothetical protein
MNTNEPKKKPSGKAVAWSLLTDAQKDMRRAAWRAWADRGGREARNAARRAATVARKLAAVAQEGTT